MRDLYKHLAIPPAASAEQIRAAIEAAGPGTLANAAQHVLLHPRRRPVYDRNHQLLTTIGRLRGRLALGMRPFWSHGHFHDFTESFGAAGVEAAARE